MRFSEIKTLDNYEICHLVLIEPTIIIPPEQWVLSGGFYRCPIEGHATKFYQGDTLVAIGDWLFDETTKEIVIAQSTMNPTANVAVCAVRFHFASKPCVLGRHLEETPLTTTNGYLTEIDPRRATFGLGAFTASADHTAYSTFFEKNFTYRTVIFEYGVITYYVIAEGAGSRWFYDEATWNEYLSSGDLGTSVFAGWPLPFLPFVALVSEVTQRADNENRHIPYQSSGEVTLYNDKDFFESKITRYTWHQARVSVYWWALESEATDPELLYQGRCTKMSYDREKIAIEFSTDLITADNPHRSDVSGFEHLQELFFSIPNISVPIAVKGKIARTPYGRVNDFTLQGVKMDTEEGEKDGTSLSAGSTKLYSTKQHLFTTVFPGDSVIFPSGSTSAVKDHGKISYGVTDSALYSFSSGPNSTLRIYCATANFGQCTAGSVVVLAANPSFNLGVGQVYGMETTDTILVTLDWVFGYSVMANVRMSADTLTFWTYGFTNANLFDSLGYNAPTTDAGIIHSTPKHYNNRKYLFSPVPIGIQTRYCFENVGSSVLGDVMVIDDTWGLFAGDFISLAYSGIRKIVSVDHVNKKIQLEGWQNVVPYASFYRFTIQSLFFVGQSGAPINVPFDKFSFTNENDRMFVTLALSAREVLYMGARIDVRVHRCVVVENPWLGDDSYPAKLADVQVGDSLIIAGFEVIVCEKINDYSLLAYPIKGSDNFAWEAQQWNAMNDAYVAEHRRYRPFDNNTRVFANAYGIFDHNGAWIQTPGQLMAHALKNIASFVPDVLVNTPQIEEMDTTYPLVSYSIPKSFEATEAETYKETINDMCLVTHSVVYSEFISSASDKYSRLTARRLFEEPTLRYLTDFDVVKEPEINIDFKGGPSQLSVRYRIGDTSSLEKNDIDWNVFYLGNKDKGERDLWLYHTGDVQAWLENELKVNTGPRMVLKVECAPGSAPEYGDRVRCDFRNNPTTLRNGEASRYIQGLVLGRTHGANGTVTLEIDNLSGLSDK